MNEEQIEKVIEHLEKSGIDVLRITNDDDDDVIDDEEIMLSEEDEVEDISMDDDVSGNSDPRWDALKGLIENDNN